MDGWHEIVKRDLTPFADPGSTINYGLVDRWLTAEWMTRRQVHTASFLESPDGSIEVQFDGRRLGYPAFLSSAELSDLLGLAGMMRVQQSPQLFVETKAHRTGNPSAEKPALGLLREALASPYET